MTLTLGQQLLAIGLFSSVLMAGLWLVQRRTKDAGVVDAGWAGSLGLSAIFAGLTGAGEPATRVLIAVMGGVWGLRLAWHIVSDRLLHGTEDGRYAMWRERLGPRVNRVFFVFFQAQAGFVIVLCVPFLLAARDPQAGPIFGLTVLRAIAAVLWVVAKLGETIADEQLKRWKADPANKGKTCRRGLWRYSRHPNYFCEWLIWCSYALVATEGPWGWLGWLAPLFMLLLVTRVTGIPPTEKRALASRGEDYRRYQRETSAFFPWFPRVVVASSEIESKSGQGHP